MHRGNWRSTDIHIQTVSLGAYSMSVHVLMQVPTYMCIQLYPVIDFYEQLYTADSAPGQGIRPKFYVVRPQAPVCMKSNCLQDISVSFKFPRKPNLTTQGFAHALHPCSSCDGVQYGPPIDELWKGGGCVTYLPNSEITGIFLGASRVDWGR